MEYLPETIDTSVPVQWDPEASAVRVARASAHLRGNYAVMIPEIIIAHKLLSSPGARTDLKGRIKKEVPTFEEYCRLAKLPSVRTVQRAIKRYNESGHLLSEDSPKVAERSPRVREQASVRYPKQVVSLDRALLRWYRVSLERFAGTDLPEPIRKLTQGMAEVWPEIYEQAMGEGSNSGYLEFLASAGRTLATTGNGAKEQSA
tara:strand:- start:1511 stop:2119 length:609 start_codon:yes stop_codon:yes gene_type:complete